MRAKSFQIEIKRELEKYFDEVEVEWPISRGATDSLGHDPKKYSPRIDVAIGPFSKELGNKREEIEELFEIKTPPRLKQYLKSRIRFKNFNPRCMLAIEVVFSGSSKHILGDITNASIMGLYGLVIANGKSFKKVKRIHKYLYAVRKLEKAPDQLFQNVAILSDDKMLSLLSKYVEP